MRCPLLHARRHLGCKAPCPARAAPCGSVRYAVALGCVSLPLPVACFLLLCGASGVRPRKVGYILYMDRVGRAANLHPLRQRGKDEAI